MLGVVPLAQAQDAASMRARHAALLSPLASSPFQLPLHIESSESSAGLKGQIYARIGQPFAVVGPALQGIGHWCDILILHLNVKGCRATTPGAGTTLELFVGRKFDQPLSDAYQLQFAYQVAKSTSDYLQVTLNAEEGPLGTSRYRIVLEAAALDGGRTFLHLSYSYAYSMTAEVAMQGYLATLGRDKVGFSVVGKQADGQPVYIGGTRGVIERNTMRYYLAIDAYLGALSAPPQKQLDQRLNAWFTGVERFPVQLHELERGEYLDMKHKEVQRQRGLGG